MLCSSYSFTLSDTNHFSWVWIGQDWFHAVCSMICLEWMRIIVPSTCSSDLPSSINKGNPCLQAMVKRPLFTERSCQVEIRSGGGVSYCSRGGRSRWTERRRWFIKEVCGVLPFVLATFALRSELKPSLVIPVFSPCAECTASGSVGACSREEKHIWFLSRIQSFWDIHLTKTNHL